MSHPLHQGERRGCEPLGRPYAAVDVELVDGDLILRQGVFVAKSDSLWVPLPDRISVRGPEGEAIRPSKGRSFFISVETFDPYHAVLEAERLPLP